MTSRKSMTALTLAIALSTAVVPQSRAQAQIDPFAAQSSPATATATPGAPVQGASRAAPAPRKDGGVIASVEFVDTPISTVFKMISDLTSWSIIMSPEVSKAPPKINLWIKNMSAQEVLDRIAVLAELVVERKGNMVEVSTFDEYTRAHGTEKRVVQLKNAKARDIAAMLQPLADREQSKVLPDEASNRVVLLVRNPLLDSLLKLIESLDVPFEKDAVRVVQLKHLEAADLAPKLEKFLADSSHGRRDSDLRLVDSAPSSPSAPPGGTPAAATPAVAAASPALSGAGKSETTRAGERWLVQFMVEPGLNAIVLRGLPADVIQTAELITKLDVPSDVTVINYPLTHSNARDTLRILEELIQSDSGRQGGGYSHGSGGVGSLGHEMRRRLKVSANEPNNQIIAEGGAADHVRLAKMLASIDRPMLPSTGGIRVYRLENSTADEVAKVLQAIVDATNGSGGAAASGSAARRVQLGSQSVEHVAPAVQPPRESGAAPAPPGGGSAAPTAQGKAGAAGPATTGGSSAADVLPPQITAAPEINAIIVKASAAEQEALAALIKELDKARDQVMLEVTLVTVRASNSFNLGVEVGAAGLGGDGPQSIGFTTFGIGQADPGTGSIRIAAPAPFGLNLAMFRADDFSVVLNALKTVGDTRITSAPKILVEDNAMGQIKQLTKEPYAVASQGTNTTITSFGGFAEAGTDLTVIPHVAEADWLRLEYQVDLSSFAQRTAQQLAANLPPPIRQNTSSGTVRIPADHIVVLGGLVSEQSEKTRQGLPVLSDIPGLGLLFGTEATSNIRETLFIFIRPVVLRDQRFTDLRLLSEDDLRKAKLARRDLPTNSLKILTPGNIATQRSE